ncbi:MAG: tRNA preQ1(34) S-adenosylmethionine ribosyltransferase-isomerase QueA [Deltaproteobacteria bacterium]|nr:tRNA preQ1(34) S-adenosylmethionine ribosyltransferase-isomerase QueA [Deltaproteobacteria bacterium]
MLSDFDYDLPEELIAQHPPERRDGGRLLVLERQKAGLVHRQIDVLPELLPAGCLLVVNDTRVLAARLPLQRDSGGAVEALLIEQLDAKQRIWSAMLKPARRLRAGEQLLAGDTGQPAVELLDKGQDRLARIRLLADDLIERIGRMPLPPYIRREAEDFDAERYQTVYARHQGSVAAPTAGLHLSPELIARLAERRIELARITLHVGPGTFLPVRVERLEAHRMHQEHYLVSERAAEQIASARRDGRPVIAVGTTSTRTLEASQGRAGSGQTDLFIRPGYRFGQIDGLLTNFHLPRSTLLMLVCALAGRERVLEAYREAVKQRYRFFSYGDAMLII